MLFFFFASMLCEPRIVGNSSGCSLSFSLSIKAFVTIKLFFSGMSLSNIDLRRLFFYTAYQRNRFLLKPCVKASAITSMASQ